MILREEKSRKVCPRIFKAVFKKILILKWFFTRWRGCGSFLTTPPLGNEILFSARKVFEKRPFF
jgi:hypothetical protein